MKKGISALALLLIGASAMAATDQQRSICKSATEHIATLMVQGKGKGVSTQAMLDRLYRLGSASAADRVVNYMVWSYDQKPDLTASELAILGNSYCVSIVA